MVLEKSRGDICYPRKVIYEQVADAKSSIIDDSFALNATDMHIALGFAFTEVPMGW